MLLRPEPGASESAARARALGMRAVVMPLFAVRPVPWSPPDPADYDALLLTSANAALHGGPELTRFKTLPVFAVGTATAIAAREAGYNVAREGGADVAALLAEIPSGFRLLHLAGRDRILPGQTAQRIETVTVYESAALPDPEGIERLSGCAIAVHSPRAAARLATLGDEARIDLASIALVALSQAVADAAGRGWERVAIAPIPTDAALLALAAELCL